MGRARQGARTLAVPHAQPQHDRQHPLSGIVSSGWYVELKRWLQCAFYVVSYFGVGILFYCNVETKPCEDVVDPEPDCTEPWTPVDSVYFVMVSMSTVGYGDFFPSRPESRVFTLFFIIYGIVVPFASLASELATVMDRAVGRFLKVWSLCFGHHHLRAWSRTNDKADAGAPGSITFWVSNMLIPVMMFTTWQIFCACVFTVLQELPFSLALYHCLVTATTVGYGDVLVTKEARPFAVVHVGVSVALLGACIAEVPALWDIRNVQLRQLEILQRALDVEMIKALDRDGNGVDKLEFCIGILIEIGAELAGLPLQWDDIVPFIEQFEAFDVDKSGHLSSEDLELMASAMEANRSELRKQLSHQMSMRRHREDWESPIMGESPMGTMTSQVSDASNASWTEMASHARQVSPKLQQMTSLPADLDPIVESPNASMSLAFGVFGAPAIVERPERPAREVSL